MTTDGRCCPSPPHSSPATASARRSPKPSSRFWMRSARHSNGTSRVGGLAGIEAGGDPLPQATLDSIKRTRLALKGPLTTPVGGGFRSVNVRLREAFGLYANLRPARTMVPGGRFEDIDLVLVRENLEGLYVAFEHYIPIGDDPHAVAISSGVNTRPGCERIIRFAFDYAVQTAARKSRSSTRPTS